LRVSRSDALFAAAVVVLVAALLAWGVRGMAIVEGRSMEPLFHTGDVVLLREAAPDEIKVGDIVVYETPDGRYIIHRVIDVYTVGETYCYIIKGDNNPVPDIGFAPCPARGGAVGVPYKMIKGVVVDIAGVPLKIPYIGGLTLLIRG